MYRHLLILPDGAELFSGRDADSAIVSVTVTELVNDDRELMPGSVCASHMEAVVLTPEGGLSLTAGDKLLLYGVDQLDQRSLLGTFWLEEPTRVNRHTLKLSGYDAVSKLDTDVTAWLSGLDQWPYSVAELSAMVCGRCGVKLLTGELPNGDFAVQPFTGEGVTGRKMMQWLGQICGRFCRATPEGSLELDWYRPNEVLTVAPTDAEGAIYYFQDSLQFGDYQVAPVEKVQIRRSQEDIVYPQIQGEVNTYIVENNPMLAARDSESLVPVARILFEQMREVTYTPGKLTVPANRQIGTGQIVALTDINGRQMQFYVMKKTSNGHTDILEGTGSHRRDTSSAVNNTGYRALSGKVLNLRADVDGRTQVQGQEATLQDTGRQISTLTQQADSFSLQLQTIRMSGAEKVETTTGYTFNEDGLHISRSDSQMENTLDHTGMYVHRYGQTLLQANYQGVKATDVTVDNYLVMGRHARLEDYGAGRTACFYIG